MSASPRNQGYAVEEFTEFLTLGRLEPFDVVFVGGGGSDWLGIDQTALMNYIDGGGKAVISHNWGFPYGLDNLMEHYGLISQNAIYKDADNTTYFNQYHSLMNGVTQLQYWAHDVSFDISFPFRELIHDVDDEHLGRSWTDGDKKPKAAGRAHGPAEGATWYMEGRICIMPHSHRPDAVRSYPGPPECCLL